MNSVLRWQKILTTYPTHYKRIAKFGETHLLVVAGTRHDLFVRIVHVA